MRKNTVFYSVILCIALFSLNGCMLIVQKGRRSDIERIEALQNELETLRHTRGILEEQLAQEIKDKQVRLAMEEKGLVITFVAEVLFDSGKAVLRQESLPILDKVARILKEEVPENNIGIEGHTDNEPIKYSGWKSNWELSAQRSLGVLHYLETKGMSPRRLSQAGYGEHRPVASNETAEGRQLNRRVEIVILPKTVRKLEQKSQRVSKEEELK
jgi:chemotaxis protein MotB